MSSEEEDTYLRNLQAEMAYQYEKDLKKQAYEVVDVDEEDGLTITSMDYTKRPFEIEGLNENPKGFIKKPYKGRKPGERVYRT